jgi:hypothetical protein
MPISCDLIGNMITDLNSLLEKVLGGLHIPLFTQSRIDQITISINGPIKIAPFSVNLDVRLIDIPRSPS